MSAVAFGPVVDEVDPITAYSLLQTQPGAVLVDVRTRAEWGFVGVPDLTATGRSPWFVEWASFPAMARNPGFLDELMARVRDEAGGQLPERFLFLCRSGARSMAAARTVAEALGAEGIAAHCSNVGEGFEGDLDAEGRRGRLNGWKVRGLPWRQT